MIAFRGFSKRYGTQLAVDDLTLTIGSGEAVALLGPNGSGKTTSLKGAAGLLHPTAGQVLIGEPGIEAIEPRARVALSFLPQRVSFPESLTGREVVEFYRRLRGVDAHHADAALKVAALNGSSARAVATYSGGMVQRLGLAVALLPACPVLLLDEPTAALDPDGLCAFYGVVDRRKAAGQTILFTSHQLGDAERLADRFAILVNGKLAACLTARELADRLAERGVLRLRVSDEPPGLLARVRRIAPQAVRSGDSLIVPGPAGDRPKVIDAVREAGGTILGLTAEEGRLDAFYRELIGGHS
jgi:Cu-processing system ATP-binding protein